MNRKKIRQLPINILLMLASIALIVFLMEAALRLWVYFEDRKVFSEAMKREAYYAPPKGVTVALRHIISPSASRKIIYELRPDISVMFPSKGVYVTTSKEGFRDKSYPMKKSRDTIRIIGIGDSMMFGQGVSDGREYLSVLEDMLNAYTSVKKWEVVNTAVPGYNTVMEVETLKEKGIKYKPDIVIIGFYINDTALPNFIKLRENSYITLRKSFFKDFLSNKLNIAKMAIDDRLYAAPRSPAHGSLEDDPDRVPAIYRDMVGWDACEKAMRELKRLSEKYGFEVIIVTSVPPPSLPDESALTGKAISLSKALGFYVVDLDPSLKKLMEANRIPSWNGSPLSVSPKDPHPSALAHEHVAKQIFWRMAANGIIYKYGR